MSVYIGPERRKGQRATRNRDLGGRLGGPERRTGIDRRQEALAGVIVGLTAEEMLRLAEIWRALDDRMAA